MADPPRTPPDPSEDETVIADEWAVRPEGQVVVEQTETARRPPRGPVIWPWLLALLLLVLGGLGALYYFTQDDDDEPAATTTAQTTTATELVRVPDVVGTTSSEATATLRDAGLEANVVPVPSDQPSGQVIAQSPAAGTQVSEGSRVRLNVAQEAAGTTTLSTTAPPPATTTPPATATSAPPPTTAPPEPATVPDAVGKETADAAREFGDEGLKVSLQYVPSEEEQGRVVAQAQPAGTERRRGDTVQLNVSIGPEPTAAVKVPDVVGRRQEQGRRTLEQAGFEVLALSLDGEVRNESPIASQTPAGGASVPRGSLVILYLRP